ncbi:MAG: 4-aminobutyrate--2-oxoglutarate transaminase [Candidatus Competibacterales bacterium]|nr:4-aminobutyrate--2-oxoglutarate transaminase [Candidatus Competibacterales bacterium]
MSTNQELLERRQKAVARGVANMHSIYTERAENAELWDVEGRRYIDFAGGIAVLNTGHRHPKVMAAVEQQLQQFTHTCFQVSPYETYIALAEKLNALVPGDFDKKTLFLTSGAEALENAVKIARAYTKRRAVIAFNGGYHGRTSLTMAMTGKVAPYKANFGPFPGDIYHAPFPIALHKLSVEHSLLALDHLFKVEIEPEQVAAMVIEPVQGEGGFYIAPPEFLQALRELCDRHGILLIVDEVQTGFARTGRLFAIEHSGVAPDLMTMAKSLAGGFPLSAVVGRAEVMDAPHPGGLGGTYGGSPVACAAALAVLEVIEQEGLIERSQALGERLTRRFRAMADRFECIGDVRGQGAMVAIELFKDAARTQPDPDLTKALVAKAAEHGLILLSCGMYGNVIRVLVPLTASDALVDEGLDLIETSLRELVAERAAA